MDKFMTAAQAAQLIRDNDTIGLMGGGGGLMEATHLFQAVQARFLATQSPRHLTVMHALGIGDKKTKGMNCFAHEGLVKRVIGVPGDRIELCNDHLLINGQPASYASIHRDAEPAFVADETVSGRTHPVMIDPHIPARRSFGPIQVPAGEYFVMGDNRDNSFDSRYFGFVPRDSIFGRATLVAMSFDHARYYMPRFDRFGQSLP